MKSAPAEAAASGGMFLFGIVVALLGAVLPLVSEPLGLGLDSAGQLFAALNGAILAGSLAVGMVIDRFGYRGPLVAGPLVIAGALVLVPAAGSLPALVGAVALLGLGGSALNAAPNVLVADLYEEPRARNAALNRLGVFFGFGALFLPFLIGALLGRLGLRPLLLAAAALCVVVAALSAVPRLPPAKQPDGSSLRQALALLRHRRVAALGLLLFFQAGSEMLVGGYLTTFLTRHTGASVPAASWVLSLYWVALMAGRAVLGRLLLRVPGTAVLPWLAGGAAAALSLVVVLDPGFGATAALFVLAALFLAGIIPTTLGLAGAAEPGHTGTVFGLLFSISVVGAMTVPWLAGHLAEAHGLRMVPLLGTCGFTAVVLLALWARRLERSGRAESISRPQTVVEGR